MVLSTPPLLVARSPLACLPACLPAVPPRRHPCPLFVFVTTSVFLPCISPASHDPSIPRCFIVSLFLLPLLYSTLSTLYHPPRSVHNSQTDLDPDPNHDSDPGLDSDPNPHAFFCSTIPSSTPSRPLAPFSPLHSPRSIFLSLARHRLFPAARFTVSFMVPCPPPPPRL